MSRRGVAFATAPRRLRDVLAATSLRRLHEPFIRSLRGPSRWVPRQTRSPFEKRRNFHRQRLVWRVNPECNFLLLRRPPKNPIFGFGRRKTAGFRSALKKKNAEKYSRGVEKVIWPPNTITRRRRKKKKTRFFRLGAEKYCSSGARRKSRFLVLGAEKKKKPAKRKNCGPKKKCGGRNFLEGSKKLFGRRTP